VGTPLQEIFVTVAVPHVTVGAVTAVPAITDAGEGLPQVSFGLTFIVPQLAVFPAQVPLPVADTV
jgi:hypothetical protein